MSRPLPVWQYPGIHPSGSEAEAALLGRHDVWATYRESRGTYTDGDEFVLGIVSRHVADFEASTPGREANLPLSPAEIFEVQTDEMLRLCRATLDDAGLPYDKGPVVFGGIDADATVRWRYAGPGDDTVGDPLQFALTVALQHSKAWYATAILLHYRAATTAGADPSAAAQAWCLFGQAWEQARFLYGSTVIGRRKQRHAQGKATEARRERAAARRAGDVDERLDWHVDARDLAADLLCARPGRSCWNVAQEVAAKCGRSPRHVTRVIKMLWN